jgi:hypothetical protein
LQDADVVLDDPPLTCARLHGRRARTHLGKHTSSVPALNATTRFPLLVLSQPLSIYLNCNVYLKRLRKFGLALESLKWCRFGDPSGGNTARQPV